MAISYLGKEEDIIDESTKKANIMCFTETFLRPHQDIEHSYIPNQDDYQVFRMDHLQMSSEDLARGGVMIVCPTLLQPVRINIECPPQLEIVLWQLPHVLALVCVL